jgi:sulfur carrier protein
VTLTVNGRAMSLPDGGDVAALVARLTDARRGVAVAVNGEVVPRSVWARTGLAEGDMVEVLTAAQGG